MVWVNWSSSRAWFIGLVLSLINGLGANAAQGGVLNGGFESGLSDWAGAGQTGVTDSYSPPQGLYQASLSTGSNIVFDSSMENFLGLDVPLDSLGHGDAVEGSALRQFVTASAGDVLSFRWQFLTNEVGPLLHDDFAFVSLVPFSGTGTVVVLASANGPPSSTQCFTLDVPATGDYILGFGVVDVGSGQIDSTLLLDDVRLEAGSCAPALDHFQCYSSLVVQAQPPAAPAVLEDALGTVHAAIGVVKAICNPANANSADPSAPAHTDHLEAHALSPQQRRQLAVRLPIRNQTVSNQFGSIALDLTWPSSLLVPAALATGQLPATPVNPGVDHFTCYRVKRSKGEAAFAAIHNVNIEDQFGTRQVTLRSPRHLCLPTDPNGADPGAPRHANHLLCYQVSGPFRSPGRVFTNSELGSGILYPRRLDELCVPSLRTP